MKHLPLKTPSFEYILKSFQEWLDIQGYAQITVYSMPNHVRGFLHYLERQYIFELRLVETKHFKGFVKELTMRSNEKYGGALSGTYINKYIQALSKFNQYLEKTGRLNLGYFKLRLQKIENKQIDVLTVDEIKALYTACDEHKGGSMNEALAARDKALLSILYGCGLRRNECFHLNVDDILFDQNLVRVLKGKNYKQRLVPINKWNLNILQSYIYDYRSYFNNPTKSSALFLSIKGTRMGHLNTSIRLRCLIFRTDLNELKQKNVTLHTLRHSIATHLLQAGMSLEHISRFLGHSSLESTQIYTHLIHQV